MTRTRDIDSPLDSPMPEKGTVGRSVLKVLGAIVLLGLIYFVVQTVSYSLLVT